MNEHPLPLLTRLSKIPPELLLVLLLIVVSVRIVQGERRTVTRAYRRAALNWVSGKTMYQTEKGTGFLYFPQAAILYIPFSRLPEPWGQIGWRSLGLILCAWSLRRLNHEANHQDRASYWGIVFITALLSTSAIRNGQSTIHMTAIMLLAAISLSRERWNEATGWLVLGLAIKPLILVMVLLTGAVIPQMRVRIVLGAMGLVLAPFLFQRPEFVLSQYHDCLTMLQSAHDVGVQTWWAQFFGMLRNAGFDVEKHAQTALRLVAAMLALGATILTYRRIPNSRRAIWLFTFSAVYILLFNPRTENNTYCLMGPALGLFYAEELGSRKRLFPGLALLLLAILTMGSHEIGKYFTASDGQAIWLAPLCCTLFCGYLAFRWREECRQENELISFERSESCRSESTQAA